MWVGFWEGQPRPKPRPSNLASFAKYVIRADLLQSDEDRLLVTAIPYIGAKRLERRKLNQRIAAVCGFNRYNVHETHAVLELERHIAQAGRLLALELLEHAGDVAFVLSHA